MIKEYDEKDEDKFQKKLQRLAKRNPKLSSAIKNIEDLQQSVDKAVQSLKAMPRFSKYFDEE